MRKWVPQLSDENIDVNQPVLNMISKYGEEKEVTSAQISLAWMLRKHPNIVPILGSKNKERILENLGAWEVKLTDAEFLELEAELGKIEVHGHRGHIETEQSTFGKNWEDEEFKK